ncbi:MAG: trimethylamine methyltransferase family protein, partial [Deltaproteobacteria bacterium]|nr:trimethylamine methyltransferase family protein [Deltaproteobacteria bacterium]
MMLDDLTFKPALSFLSDQDKDRVHAAIFEILSEVGMKIMQAEALSLLKEAGCAIATDGKVSIPAQQVKEALASAPENISVFDRKETQVMDLGGRRSYFGTGSDLIYALDSQKMSRRQCVLEDVVQAASVCDALPHIDFIMSFAHPSDITPARAYLLSFQAMAQNSIKPIVCTAEGRDDLEEMWEIACILRGGTEALQSKPYFVHYAEPISPLKHPRNSLDKLLFCAE